MNVFDHNAIVGLNPACDNLYFANGFSGRGLQQSAAVGRGLAELILTGDWRSLDLSPVGFERILKRQPLLEENVIWLARKQVDPSAKSGWPCVAYRPSETRWLPMLKGNPLVSHA